MINVLLTLNLGMRGSQKCGKKRLETDDSHSMLYARNEIVFIKVLSYYM